MRRTRLGGLTPLHRLPLAGFLLLAGLPLILSASVARAQNVPEIRGYALDVGQWAESSDLFPAGLSDIGRLRLMSEPVLGPLDFELAYEHLLLIQESERSVLAGPAISAAAPSGGEWIDLSGTIAEGSHASWSHRLDRFNVGTGLGDAADIRVGRQTISFATTLFLTPADPFLPFDPADPFREYRAGVDAARLRAFLGPFSEAELVVRPSDTPVGETLTALGRGRTLLFGWEVAGWAGVLHDEAALAVGTSGAIGPMAVRGEVSFRELDDGLSVRSALGADRRFSAFGRDLYLVLEYQHDDFGAGSADEILDVLTSEPFARGELQVIGRDELAAQGSYQLHPLWGGVLLVLWNLNDGSALLAPSLSYSASDEASLSGGIFWGIGAGEADALGVPRSEYGAVPLLVYASLSLFF